MNSLLPPRRVRTSADDNLVPMINIVFLLLIFFMVAGQISAPDGDVSVPQSGSRKPVPEGQLELSLTAGGELLQGGEPLAVAQLPELIAEQALVGTRSVVLKADRNATAQSLDQVFAVLRSQGISLVTLRTLSPEAGQ